MNNIILSVLSLFGINQAPATVQEYLWDMILISVGIAIIKAILAFVFGFFKEVGKI